MLSKKALYYALSTAVTAVVLYYIFQQIDLKDVVNHIRLANPYAVLAFIRLALLGSLARAWRFKILLLQSGHAASTRILFWIVIVRNLCADILPAKLGTAAYIFLANRCLGINLIACTSSFILAMVFDMLAIAPLVLIAAWEAFGQHLESLNLLVIFGLTVAVAFGVLLWKLKFLLLLCTKLITATPFLGTFQEKFLLWINQVIKEVDQATSNRIYFPVFLLSLIIRFCKYGSLYFLLYAFLQPLGSIADKLSIAQTFLGFFASELAASSPVSGIGGFGAYEAAWVFTFSLMGLPEKLAGSTAIAHHVFTQFYGAGLGALGLIVLLLVGRKLAVPTIQNLQLGDFYRRALGLTLAVVLVPLTLVKIPDIRKLFFDMSYGETKEAPETQRAKLIALGLSEQTRIIFASNRSGSFGIYQLNPFDNQVSKLIDTSAEETYPDISPDARLITYSIPKTLAQEASGSVWLSNADGSNQQKIAGNALFSSFSADGKNIFYEKKRLAVFKYDLVSKNHEKIFPLPEYKFKRKALVVKPRISSDQTWLTFTSNFPRRWTTWFVNLKTKEMIQGPNGCQGIWLKDLNRVLYVQDSSKPLKAKSAIWSFNPNTKASASVIDDAKPWGHEYFPSPSADNRFITYSACPHFQHRHNDSNYQIFIAANQANTPGLRLQNDRYTNIWPKAFNLPQP